MAKKTEKAVKAVKAEKPKKEKAKRGSKERFEFIVQQLEDLSKAVRNLNAELGNVRAELRKLTKDPNEFAPVGLKRTRRGS